jgi:CHAT domain-containing protein/tetratricopeptide (TPR) repeat protein
VAGLASACGGRPKGGGDARPDEIRPAFRAVTPTDAPVLPTHLTAFSQQEVYGRLSPSGRVLVYSSNAKDSFDLFLRDLSTGEPIQISTHPAMDTMPAWSPDGEQIVFVSMRDDVKGDLYLWGGDDEDTVQLTGRRLGELFPTFSPDGRFLYFAQGPEGSYRLARLDLSKVEDKKDRDDTVAEKVLTGEGFSHPAVSPDGTLLAATRFLPGQPAQIVLMEIRDAAGEPTYGEPRIVTAGAAAKGFPTFGPDGSTLYFTAFHNGVPRGPDADADGAIFSVPVEGLLRGDPAQNTARAVQLTPDRGVSVLTQAHASGLVFGAGTAGNFDILLAPPTGLLPAVSTPAALTALAAHYAEPAPKAFVLRGLARFPATPETQRGLADAQLLYADVGEFEQVEDVGALIARHPSVAPEIVEPARCLAASARARATKAREAETGVYFDTPDADAALKAVQAVAVEVGTPAGKAQCRLEEGRVRLLAGDWRPAADAFRAVLSDPSSPAPQAALAFVHHGEVLSRLPEGGGGTAEYFLGTFDRFPGEARALDAAAYAALRAAAAPGRPAHEIENLRRLLDRHLPKARFAARAQFRLGQLYAETDQKALAAAAMETVADRWPAIEPEASEAARLAGRYAVHLAADLREQGRFNEASTFFDRALAHYERVMKAHPPLNRLHREARANRLALSLQRAFQAEQDGDREKALGLYQQILGFEPQAVQAIRKVVQFRLQAGLPAPATESMTEADVATRRKEIAAGLQDNWDALYAEYETLVDTDETDFAATYALGYLWTFDPDLSAKSLDNAEKFLERAVNLDPTSPFPHMTLGWVHLMREQYFGLVKEPWVVRALDEYQIAYALNDRGIDLQTEADLLVSHGNAWAALGNGWTHAYEKYHERQALVDLGARFTHDEQQAMFYFSFAKAAYMTDHYAEAEDHYETARVIARNRTERVDPVLAEGYREMLSQIVAHLALVNHFMGDYESSNRYFEQTIKVYRDRGKVHLLPALTRSMAYNLILLGRYDEAILKLAEARALYEEHGALKTDAGTRIALTPEGSLFFGGFVGESERHVQTALMDLVYRDNHALWYAAQEAARQLEQRERLYKENENPDFARAMWILKGRVAASALKAGDRATFARELDEIYDEAVELQWDDAQVDGEEFQGRPELFEFMVTGMTNRAEQMLQDLAAGTVPDPEALGALAERLRRMEDWRKRIEVVERKVLVIDEEQRLKYLNATALLFLAQGRALAAEPKAAPGEAADAAADPDKGKKSSGWGSFTLRGKFDQWMLQTSYFADAAGLLLDAVARTAPEPDPKALPRPDTAATFVVDRVRWHVESLMNLAEVASYFSARDAIQKDRGMEALERARGICRVDEALARNAERARLAAAPPSAPPSDAPEAEETGDEAEEAPPAPASTGLGDLEETPLPVALDLGAACWLVDMEIASRRNDLPAARAVVQQFVDTWPGLLGPHYATHGRHVRARLFTRAMELALAAGDHRAVLEFAELADRKLVTDEIAGFGFASPSPPLQAALDPIRQWTEFARRAWLNQSTESKAEDAHEAALEALAKARDPKLWEQIRARIATQSPEVHDLLTPTALPEGDLVKALGNDASILTAVPVSQRVVLFSLRVEAGSLKVEHAVLEASLSDLAAAGHFGEQNLDAVTALLPVSVKNWIARDATVYFDLLRLGPDFPVEALARLWAPKARHVFLAGIHGLVDAWRHRNLYVKGGLVLGSETLQGVPALRSGLETTLKDAEDWRVLEEDRLGLARTPGYMQQAGMQLWALPLRVEEDAVANIRLGLKGKVEGLEDYRFPLRLGDRFKTSFVAALALYPGLRAREAAVLTTRYLHALGVPTVGLLSAGTVSPEAVVAWVDQVAPKLGSVSAAEAVTAVPPLEAPRTLAKGEPDEDPTGRDVVKVERLRLYGWPGLSPKDVGAAGTRADQMAREGRLAFETGQHRAAAASLEPALALWAAAGDTDSEKVLDTQAMLARTHATLGDTRSAVLLQLAHVEALEKKGGDPARRYAAWLEIPVWQAAGGRSEDALETIAAIRASLEQAIKTAEGPAKGKLQGYLADALAHEGTALENLGRFAPSASSFEAAAAMALAARRSSPDAASLDRRVAEDSALAARVARVRLSDSARAKRNLVRARQSMPAVDAEAYFADERQAAALITKITGLRDEVEAEVARNELRTVTARLVETRRNVKARAIVLREFALVKFSRSDAAGALVDAQEAFTLADALPEKTLAHSCRSALSAAYRGLGDADMALATADAGVQAARLSPYWHGRLNGSRGRALVPLGRLDEARAAFEIAANEARAANDPDGYSDALRGKAQVAMAAGDFGSAAAEIRHAELEDREREDKVRVADDLVLSGKTLMMQGNLAEARARLTEARTMGVEASALEVQVRAGLELGRVLLREKDAPGALSAFDAALEAEGKLSLPGIRWMLLAGRAEALAAAGKTGEALAGLEAAAEVVELLPAQPRRRAGQPRIDMEFKDVYDLLVSLNVREKRAEAAFHAAERWRSRGFVDLAARGAAALSRGRAALDAYNAALSVLRQAETELAETSERERAGLRKAVDKARTDAEAARKALEGVDAQFPAFLAVNARPWAELSGKLPEGTVLLAYHTTPTEAFAFVGRRDGLSAVTLPAGGDAITSGVRAYRRHTTAFDNLEVDARRLFDQVLAPVQDKLAERVLVVPEGPLNLLPFAGLHTGRGWAVEKYTFAYLPSATHLAALDPVGAVSARNPVAFNWAGMGPETEPKAGTKRYFRRLEEWRDLAARWPALPFTRKETEAFREAFPQATVYAGLEATRETFLAKAAAADLLEIATHGSYVADNPMLSYLQFGGTPKGQLFPAFESQRVTLYDILGLPLKASVAVLSACDTGLSDPEGGEGLAGIHRAFLAAGARTVVSSLWRISDLAAGVVVKNFHRNLRQQDPATALRQAQLKVMRSFPHPANWAGFRLDGLAR